MESMYRKIIFSIFLLTTVCEQAAGREVRQITPPNLSEAHLGKKILCHRPMRRGVPKMEVEQIGSKTVIHNFGHGGSGWTLGPGCAQYVVALLEQTLPNNILSTTAPITVIGAGALGLYTAYELVQKGCVVTVVAESFDNLTSHNAGGLLAPVSMDNAPELQPAIDKIGIDAYLFYKAIAQHQPGFPFQKGAVIVPTYFRIREDSGLEPYVGKVMQAAKDVTLDFGTGTTQDMVSYDDGIFIDTAIMMESLTMYLKAQGVTFVQKRVQNFDELADTFIFNCTGLNSKGLYEDDQMISVQGHLIMLKDQDPQDLQYMALTYGEYFTDSSGNTGKRSFYMFPKQLPGTGVNDVGVIGGTFIEGATPETPNLEEFDRIIQGAKDFYGIK